MNKRTDKFSKLVSSFISLSTNRDIKHPKMIVSHKFRFIFIHIQRTGGNTLINLLRENLNNEIKIYAQHGNARSEESILLERYWDYYTFSFVRNPWARLFSWYALLQKWENKSLKQYQQGFEHFLRQEMLISNDPSFHYNQFDYLSNLEGELLTEQIFRYEDYDSESQKLFKRWGIELQNIPVINPSKLQNYRAYYSDFSKKFVAENCQKDIEYFGYSF